MITVVIKFLKWKKAYFGKLVKYIQQNFVFDSKDTDIVLHNLRSNSLNDIIEEFQQNDSLRTNLRKNSVRINHDILSFHSADREFLLDFKIREIIALEYIEKRCPHSLVFGRWHFDRSHIHLHLCISSSQYRSPNKILRLNNYSFSRLRKNIELFQQQQFPELFSSIVHLEHKGKKKDSIELEKTEKEFQIEKRNSSLQMKNQKGNQVPTEKELLQDRLSEMINYSDSRDDFFDSILKQPDLELYGYPGLYVGVQIKNSRKYRFETLKLHDRILELDNQELQQIKKRELELQAIRSQNQNKKRKLTIER